MATNPISFRSQSVEKRLELKTKNPFGALAAKELSRYFNLLKNTLLKLDLDCQECALICDALKNLDFDEFQVHPHGMLLCEIKEQINTHRLADKWQVNDQLLLKKIECYTPLEAVAIVDAKERFWWSRRDKKKADENEIGADFFDQITKSFNLRKQVDILF